MKKILLLLLFIISITGCSKEIVENKVEEEKTIPNGLSIEKGEGNIYINTPTSIKEKGNIPILYTKEYEAFLHLGLQSDGIDNSKPSYIYIDEKLNSIERLSNENSATLTICDEEIKEGIHKVEIVQFDNDKTRGTPVLYKSCKYEIKLR